MCVQMNIFMSASVSALTPIYYVPSHLIMSPSPPLHISSFVSYALCNYLLRKATSDILERKKKNKFFYASYTAIN